MHCSTRRILHFVGIDCWTILALAASGCKFGLDK